MNICARRTITNAFLVLIFLLLEAVVVLPLASQICLRAASDLENGSQWREAAEWYARAAFLSPFDTKYLTGNADFLLRQSFHKKDKGGLLKKARALYQRASEIEPYSAEHALTLGALEIRLFLQGKALRGREISRGIHNLKLALANDPFGVNAAFLAGHAAMSVWQFLEPQERELFLVKLKYALTYRPWYAKGLYAHVWGMMRDFSLLQRITPENAKAQQRLLDFIRKNDLWQFRSALRQTEDPSLRISRIQGIRRSAQDKPVTDVISSGDWQGASESGRNVYKNGNMYWNGTIDAMIRFPQGASVLVIRAKAQPAENIYPYMIVELDGRDVAGGWVQSRDWRDYAIRISTDAGIKVLSITYVNDVGAKATGEDMNLFIKEARVISGAR